MELPRRPLRVGAIAIAVALLLDGCAAAPTVSVPPAGARFDYQLGGAYPPPKDVTVVARDSTDAPASGSYGICYINGFQSQPGAVWPKDLLLHRPSGALLVDPGWPDEHLFDTSTAAKRTELARRLGATIRLCAQKGFAAVEFDNLDSYTRSRGALSLDDAIAFATLLVQDAHAAGLAAAQKNTAELRARGHDDIGFDFAITEECDRYRECSAFTKVYGGLVFDIEYTDDLRGSATAVCARARATASAPSTIVRDRDLVRSTSPAYVYVPC
jgi:hypothetical protein